MTLSDQIWVSQITSKCTRWRQLNPHWAPTLANVGDNTPTSTLLLFLPTRAFYLVGIVASLSPGDTTSSPTSLKNLFEPKELKIYWNRARIIPYNPVYSRIHARPVPSMNFRTTIRLRLRGSRNRIDPVSVRPSPVYGTVLSPTRSSSDRSTRNPPSTCERHEQSQTSAIVR